MKRLTLALLPFAVGCGLLEEPTAFAWQPVPFDQPFAPPPGYYQQAEALAGPPLIQALHNLVDQHRELSYDAARDAMIGIVDDLDNDDAVPCLLTGRSISGITNRQAAYRKGMNAEHVWPQSLGGEGPAKSDLHHLFPAEIFANELRGSHPYLNVSRTQELLPDHTHTGDHAKLGTTADGLIAFEPPNRNKGDIARALLYVYVRYATGTPYDGAFSMRNFQHEKRLLLDWHRSDPVDQAERARNQAIFGLQRNRNPFVDRPEFVDRLAEWLGS